MFRNSKIASAVRLAMFVGAGAAAAISAPAFSQEDAKVERIDVTGSAIKRTDMEGSLPVTIITAEDIARTGVESVGDLMAQLPAMQGFTTTSDSVGGSGAGMQTASLHDLGAQYTLVLLNGRRLAPRGSGSTIDLNSIPLSAIARVDVLTDGAGALYGSDAIAGVVNFILKDSVDETTITGRVTRPQDEGGAGWNGSITTGFGDIDKDGFSILLSYGHDSKDQLASKDRDFAKTGIISFEDNGRDLYFFNGSPNAIPGNGAIYTDDFGQRFDFNPNSISTGSCAENTSALGDWCWFDYTSTLEILPESERDSLLAKIDFNITDDIQGFVEGSFSDFSMTTRIAPYPSGLVPVPVGSPLFNQYFAPNLESVLPEGYTVDDIDGAYGVWRALPAGNRTTEWNTKSLHVVAGVEGSIGDDIDFDVAITHSVNDTSQNYPTGWLIEDKFVDAVASGAVDIFATAGTVTQAEVDATGMVYSGPWSKSKTVMQGIDGKMSMPVFELSGGDAYMAVGADYRKYDFDNSLSQANQDSILLFLSASTPYHLKRNVYAAFTELYMPVMDNLEVTASLRYDHVGAVDSMYGYDLDGLRDETLSGSTINESDSAVTYKISSKWQATEDLLIRASYGTGFKAPSMLEIARPRVEFGVTGGNYTCPFDASDAKAAWCKPGSQQYNVYNQGNPDLQSEESTQHTLGFVYAPDNKFSFGLDYWSVEMTDVVTSLTEAQIFADPARYYDLFTFKTNTATGLDELAIIRASVNVGKSVNSGIDWHFNQSTELGFGEFHFGWTGTYMIDSTYTRPGTTDDWISSMSKFGDNNAVTFRLVNQLNLGLEHGDFYHNVTVNYKSGYLDQFQSEGGCAVTEVDAFGDCVAVQLSISSYTKVDYQTKYNVTENASVTFGINNLLDVQPDLSLRSGGAGHQVGFDPRYVDAYGRTLYVTGEYQF